ncbi:hypothetical protein Q0M94_24420 (plasmid) [Deinococcus radiomollis]|uniref:hypothetical protein n=1 Tax=Deinococcus radiomollis TaxID=468916 RepID=UPI003892C6CC
MLIWVLVLGVVLAAIMAFSLTSGKTRAFSGKLAITDSNDQRLLGDANSSTQRVLTVHANELANAVLQPASPAGNGNYQGNYNNTTPQGGVDYAGLIQQQADAIFCNRHAQAGVKTIVAFSPTVCGVRAGADMAPVQTTGTPTGGTVVDAPYVVSQTTDDGASKVIQGSLKFVLGAVPVSAYALYQGGDATLGADVSVTGPAYVLGNATLRGLFTASTLDVSGCAAPGAGCQPSAAVHFGDGQVVQAMGLVPTPAHPCIDSGCLGGTLAPGVTGDTSPQFQALTNPLANIGLPDFDRVKLGIADNGDQRIALCTGDSCAQFLLRGDQLLSETGTPLLYGVRVFGTTRDVVVEPEVPGSPSVSGSLGIQTTGTMTVNGDVRLSNSPCANTTACSISPNPPSNLLSLLAGGTVTVNSGALDAAILTNGAVLGQQGGTLLLGSAAAAQSVSNLKITHDPRLAMPYGQIPAGFQFLSAPIHLIALKDGQ